MADKALMDKRLKRFGFRQLFKSAAFVMKGDGFTEKIGFYPFLNPISAFGIFDMGNISTPYRIISFIVLGLLLLGASYLYYRQKGATDAPESTVPKGG